MKHLIVFVFTLFTLNACQASPLFNHENASNRSINADVSDESCPLDFPTSRLCSKIEWIAGPNGSEENSFYLKFWNKESGSADGPYVNPDHAVAVQLWMPSMGHGSSPVTVTEETTGVFLVTRVFFVMPGDWDIRVKLRDASTVIETAVSSVVISE